MQLSAMDEVAGIIAEKDARIAELSERVAVLTTQIAWLQKQLFGAGKGEKLDRDQLEMKFTELQNLLEFFWLLLPQDVKPTTPSVYCA